MNVRQLLALLANAHPDTPVCIFTDSGPEELERVRVYNGNYRADNSPKLTWRRENGFYVGIGNPGDFEVTETYDRCRPVFNLKDNKAIEQ
jgi:hypothetical protein